MAPEAVALGGGLAALGWLGQGCFFSRFFVQWVASERARASVAPAAFWWLSLAGAVLMSAFTLEAREIVLLPGFAVGGAIAVRNLTMRERRTGRFDLVWLLAVALVSLVGLTLAELRSGSFEQQAALPWLVIGVTGQLLWITRFPLQWFASERAGRSHFPLAFWWISLAGNLLLLAYSLHSGVLVYVLGFLPGPLVQIRNLVLAGGSRRSRPA